MRKNRGALGPLTGAFLVRFSATCPSEALAQADQKLTIDVPWGGFTLIYE
jgi:hypothetical protein